MITSNCSSLPPSLAATVSLCLLDYLQLCLFASFINCNCASLPPWLPVIVPFCLHDYQQLCHFASFINCNCVSLPPWLPAIVPLCLLDYLQLCLFASLITCSCASLPPRLSCNSKSFPTLPSTETIHDRMSISALSKLRHFEMETKQKSIRCFRLYCV